MAKVMRPVEMEDALTKCSYSSEYGRSQAIKRWRWAVDGYLDLFADKEWLEQERQRFMTDGERFLVEETLYRVLSETKREPTEADETRRREWLEREAQSAVRAEMQRQRRRLREGHQVLTAIRRHLRGAAPLLPQGSRLAKTSRT